MNKNIRVVLLVLLSIPGFMKAQGLDFSIGGGGITYQGELSKGHFFKDLFDLKLSGTAGLTLIPNKHYTIGIEYHRGRVGGDDRNAYDSLQVDRGLNFSTLLQEVSVFGEYHFLQNADLQSDSDFSPYVSLGFSWFRFNPVATYNDISYQLNTFGTEGQLIGEEKTLAYKKHSFSIPLGIGLKYHINSLFAVKADIKGRYSFTDYIDDVSGAYPDHDQLLASDGLDAVLLSDRRTPATFTGDRGDKRFNDGYVTYTVSLIVHILPAYRKDVFCPKIEKPALEF